MSGETEASVSGWTVDTLRELVSQRIAGLDRVLSRRMDDADKATATALATADKARTEAKEASDKRFEGVNEFRRALADQTATFLPRAEYDARHKALDDRVTANAERLAGLELRLTSRLDLGEGATSGAAGFRTEQRLNLSQVVAVIAVLIAAATLVLYATKK